MRPRLVALVLLAALSAEVASPVVAANMRAGDSVPSVHTAAHADRHHHEGCPWRRADGPCPHETGAGPSLTGCGPSAAAVPHVGHLAGAGAAVLQARIVCRVEAPSPPPPASLTRSRSSTLDPPPPRTSLFG